MSLVDVGPNSKDLTCMEVLTMTKTMINLQGISLAPIYDEASYWAKMRRYYYNPTPEQLGVEVASNTNNATTISNGRAADIAHTKIYTQHNYEIIVCKAKTKIDPLLRDYLDKLAKSLTIKLRNYILSLDLHTLQNLIINNVEEIADADIPANKDACIDLLDTLIWPTYSLIYKPAKYPR